MLALIGRACCRHRLLTVVSWLAGLAVLLTLWISLGAPADNDFTGSDPGQTLLNQYFPQASGDTLTLAVRSAAAVSSPAVRPRVEATVARFARAAEVSSVTSPYTTPGHVSARDEHIAYATVQFRDPGGSVPGAEITALMNEAAAASGPGVTFSLGGDLVDQQETPYGGPSDGFGIGAAIVVLLLVFGSLLAMALPVGTALAGIGTGLSLIALLGHVFPAPSFAPVISAMIGFGVGVDYALFIVTRFRAELAAAPRGAGTPGSSRAAAARRVEEAVEVTLRTAGGSVLTAGTTVVIGLLGLLVLRQQLLDGVAVAAAATVAMTVAAALTLLPALLGYTGTRLARPTLLARRRHTPGPGAEATSKLEPGPGSDLAPGPTSAGPGRWERWARVIQRHRVTAILASVAVIALLAAPALTLKLAMPDESAQPRGTMGYASYQTMVQGFGPGYDAPLLVAAKLPGPAADVRRLQTALAAVPGIASVTPPVLSRGGAAALLTAYPATREQDAATNELANHLEDTVLPQATAGTGIQAYLTGPNAANVSFADLIGDRLPELIAIVLVLSTVLLLRVFRSVLVAVKAAAMNLLSVTAAYGVLTAVTQWGWGGRLFGFPEQLPVTTWVPVFLFVILFGLSMDYEVFLISRIREAHLAGYDNGSAIARGLAQTGRVISAAAAIMVIVFLGFTATPDVSVKQIGLGLAVAVAVDATVVRLALVPALMELFGQANWWPGTAGPVTEEAA